LRRWCPPRRFALVSPLNALSGAVAQAVLYALRHGLHVLLAGGLIAPHPDAPKGVTERASVSLIMRTGGA
jgi:hypothetical protein